MGKAFADARVCDAALLYVLLDDVDVELRMLETLI
jgi:hypothetical protein